MQLSIIILNYNVRYFLELCVSSVVKAIENLNAEIIVVDNNSSDDSCAMMKTRFPNIKLIENKENSGFPKGNNIGVAQAKGNYICILNPDTVVAEDSFEKVLAFAKNQENLGIIGCKLVDGRGHFLPECKRGTPTPWVSFTKIFALHRLFPAKRVGSFLFQKYYAEHITQDQTGKVDILVGAFMIMKRDLYNEVGGFDEKCFMYSDDIDLSYMVLQKGKSNFYFHETSVIHYKGESTIKNKVYLKRFQEGMNFFYEKHFKTSLFFTIFMKFGILLFVLTKKFRSKPIPKIAPNKYIFVSNNETLQQAIKNKVCKSVVMQTDFQKFVQSQNTEIIFDANFIDNSQIIATIEAQKNNGYTFKILCQNASFLIGSNDCQDRGEVILL
jgi:GT2 family glycosyltransferase